MTATLRSIVGAQPATQIDAAHTALVLIDFQNEYFTGRLPIPDGLGALRQAVKLVEQADAHGIPVYHVRHVNDGPLFTRGSLMSQIHGELTPAAHHHVVQKTTVSTFASTDLHAQLQARGITTLIVAGLMTHMCVSTMARDARQFGLRSYNVLVAADACATRDIDGWDGGVVSHQELHRATLTALSDNFAQVLNTADVLALPVTAQPMAKEA